MTTKTLTIVRGAPAKFGNTAGQTTSTIEVDTSGTLAVRARVHNGTDWNGQAYWKTFKLSEITTFAVAAGPAGGDNHQTLTVTVTQPDGSHSIDVPLAIESGDAGYYGASVQMVVTAANRKSTSQSHCGTHDEIVDLSPNLASITLA